MISLINTNHLKASFGFYNSVISDVKFRLDKNKIILNNYKVNSGGGLYDYLEKNLDDFLINDLKTSFDKHNKELKYVFDTNFKDGNSPNKFTKVIKSIFFYDDSKKWEPYKILKILQVNCCPYCNRTYITNLGNDKKKFYRADFDHFLNKSKYPYFRFHFYNLIPSCIICNQRAKGNDDTDLDNFVYPYMNGFEEHAKFTYTPSSYDALKKGYGSIIRLKVKFPRSNFGKKIRNNIKLFRINEQYKTNQRELHFLLEKKDINSEGYIKSIRDAFPHLFRNDADAYEFIFGKSFYEKDFIHQPLAKFTKDICEEIGLIK